MDCEARRAATYVYISLLSKFAHDYFIRGFVEIFLRCIELTFEGRFILTLQAGRYSNDLKDINHQTVLRPGGIIMVFVPSFLAA